MNGENNKKQEAALSMATYAVTLVLHLGVYTVGAACRGSVPFASGLYGLCTGLLLLAAALSGLIGQRYAKAFGEQNVREANDLADLRRQRMAQDSRREWRRLRLICVFSIAYIVLLFLLCLAVPFFFGASQVKFSMLFADIISLWFLSGLVGRLLQPGHTFHSEGVLPEKDFPLLYGMVRDAAGEWLRDKKLHIRVIHSIPHEECTAAVALEHDHVTILFGSVLLCVADEEELRQVVLHELAHLEGNEVQEDRLYKRVLGYINSSGRTFFSHLSDWALTLPVAALMIEGQFYFLLSSREKERRADNRAAHRGDREKQASVLAKISAHGIYAFEQEPYMNVFVTEEIPQHLMTDRAMDYRRALSEREQDWRRMLENEIPSRVASHPTFRQRWEALDFCAYSLEPADMDSDFSRECWAAAHMADEDRASIPVERYAELRKKVYLDELAIIEEFESREWDLTPDELRPPMLAYFNTGRPDKMEAICDKIIAENDSLYATAFARYWKGVLLLYRYDHSGIRWLYEAMELNTNYIEEGLDRIGSYCTRMGLQKELEEYRSRAIDFMQLKMDRSHGGITAKADLRPEALPEGWLDKIRDFIVNAGEDCLQEIYLVKEVAQEDYAPSSFVLRFTQDAPQERREDVYDKVFRLLDDWPVDWEFCLYTYDDSMAKPLSRVEGSCIWRK